MSDYLSMLTDPAPFMPHGMCLLWQPGLIWLHLVSDVLTGVAYYSIPVALFVFVRRRKDLAFGWMFVLFALFIAACGTTHLFGAWTLWHADYVTEGLIKAVTAGVSLATALALWPLIPRALALPSPAQLRAVNAALNLEIGERLRAERQVRDANAELERRVAERTAALEAANRRLQEMNDTLERRVAGRTAELADAVGALRASEAQLAGILDNTPDGIFLLESGADGRIRFLGANPAFRRIACQHGDDLAGRTLDQVVGPRVAAEVAAPIADCLSQGSSPRFEIESTGPDGNTRFWQATLAPVLSTPGGPTRQIVGAVRDMTEHRALHEELTRTARLATLGALAAGVAHEMSQPLNAIRITASDCCLLLEEDGPGADLDYVHDGLRTIRDQSTRMGGIVDQLRRFGRGGDGRGRPFDPAVPLRAAVELMRRALSTADIDITLDAPDSLPLVTGQAGQVEQVLVNLLANAGDAIAEVRERDCDPDRPGSIAVTAGLEGRQVVLAVLDNGVGLSAAVAARIFDPFFTTKDADKGMGLGLSISASLVQSMGGSIAAEPVPGGARFVVRLPLADVDQAGARPAVTQGEPA